MTQAHETESVAVMLRLPKELVARIDARAAELTAKTGITATRSAVARKALVDAFQPARPARKAAQ